MAIYSRFRRCVLILSRLFVYIYRSQMCTVFGVSKVRCVQFSEFLKSDVYSFRSFFDLLRGCGSGRELVPVRSRSASSVRGSPAGVPRSVCARELLPLCGYKKRAPRVCGCSGYYNISSVYFGKWFSIMVSIYDFKFLGLLLLARDRKRLKAGNIFSSLYPFNCNKLTIPTVSLYENDGSIP